MFNELFSTMTVVLFNTCLPYLIPLICMFPLTLADIQCRNQGDCNDGKNINCGICVNNGNSRIGNCTFPFTYMFGDSEKCTRIEFCERNCSNHGDCDLSPMPEYKGLPIIIPACNCSKGFYGRTCENSSPKDAPDLLLDGSILQINFHFVGMQSPFTKIGRWMYVRCSTQVTEVTVSVETETDDGGFYSFNRRTDLQCKVDDRWNFNIFSRFPYKPFGRHSKVIRFGNEVLGYLSVLRHKIKFNGIDHAQYNFSVFVSYEEINLVCIPAIKLSGCASSESHENIFVQSRTIKISSNVMYIADGRFLTTSKKNPLCEENAKFHWRIWDGHNETKNPVLEYFEIKDFTLDPYTLKFKSYKVLLEVTNMRENNISQNFAYCYFRMKSVPLVAIIDGGSERTVGKQNGLILGTSRSHDPNMPPDEQSHLHASWSCVDVSEPRREICNPSHSIPLDKKYIVPSEKLSYGAVYNITLRVWTNHYDSCTHCENIKPAFDNAMITIANKTDGEENFIYIQCLLNCGKKVVHNQQLYLRVKVSAGSTKNDYAWTYYEKGQPTEKDTKNLTVEGVKLPSFMFIAKENAFSSGKSYVIVIRTVNKANFATVKYAFQTLEVEFEGNCTISPNSGTKGFTLFEIQCQNFRNFPIYEFYDKTVEEVESGLIFNGRMLGTSQRSEQGELRDFRVTRGQIMVYVIDESGLYTEVQFKINLFPYNITQKVIEQLFGNITDLLNQGEIAQMLECVSSVSDIVPIEMDKSGILNDLLHFITLVPTDTLANIKLTTSTLANVLSSLNKPIQLAIEPRLMRDTLHIVRNQTYSLSRIVSEWTELNGMSPKEIRLVATYQLDCLHAALMCKDPRTVGITEFDYDLKTLDDLMDSSKFAEDTIYLVKDILSILQTPGQPPTKISSKENSNVWVVENDEEQNLTNYLSKYDEIPVVVSNELLKEFGTGLRMNHEELSVRVATLNDNIFWWSKSDIKSNLISVSLVRHSTTHQLARIKFVKNIVSIKISLNSGLNSTLVKGSVRPYKDSETKCTLENDLTIQVHRLDIEPHSLITLTFLFPPTNGSLLVLVIRNYRPDCYVMKNSRIINETFPTYTIAYNDEEPTFYFIGITPKANVSVKYTYEVNTTVCQFWAEGHWSSKGCRISLTSKYLDAHCTCDHFSIFAAAFPVSPQEIDLFSDINLFLTVWDNPLVVSFVTTLLIIYLICCFWALYRDTKDKSLKNIIILDDNFPEDSFPYLMAVYTSSRFNAGTTANVGIKINGSSASSRAHILACKERRVLKRNYDDWFLIYCPEPLGELQNIHIWHDNSGSSPDWFCDKIIIYDLRNNSEIVFVVEQWIALRLTYFPEATVRGASVSEVYSVKRIFLDNCILGLRENHTLLCINLRHPRSEVSRLQRINVLMCCLMTVMLCSIMFYSPQVDNHAYSVGLRDFYISIQSLVISFITTVLVIFAFKRSYKYKYSKTESTVQYRPSGYKEFEVNSKNDKSAYSNFVRFVSKTMKGTPLIPAQLKNSEPVVVVIRKWRFLAWVLCIGVIITCSFLIMLYGLKLGLVKSQIWLSSVIFTLSEDFLFSTPARIIFVSIILSITFQKLCEVDNYRIDTKDILTIKPLTSEEHMDKLLIKRRHQMYAPLRADFKNEMLKNKELWRNWMTVLDFTEALCFIFVVSAVVFNLWSSHYYNNDGIKNIMTYESKDSVRFFTLRNVSQVDHYLKDSVLRSLYITFWYNQDPIQEKDIDRGYWAKDFTHTIVGHQRYRQIRVSPVQCEYSLFTNTTRHCIPHYDGANEDKGDHGSRWLPAQWHDTKQSTSAWKYTDMSRSRFSTLYRLCGKSGVIFHDGGYLTDLGPTRVMADAKAEIVSQNWQDQLTRAVFVEFTLYNINVNLFSQVTLIVEYLISGTIQLKAQVVSVESRMKLSFWKALFCAFLVYCVIRSGYLINRQGLMEYLSSSRNRSRLVIVFLGGLSITVAATHFFSSTAYHDTFINRGYGDTYFDFDSFVYYFMLLQMIMTFLLTIAIFRTIFIFRGGRTLLNFFYTLTISLPWILLLSAVIFMFLLVQVPLIILINIFSFYNIKEIVLNIKFTQYFKCHSSELKYLQVFLYVKCAVVNCLLYLYILIFLHYFKIARTYKMRKSDKFNLILFVLSHIKNLCKKRKK